MPLFTKGETVKFHGYKTTVEEVYNNGQQANLVCEIIPFMPTRFMGISYTEVER